MTGIDELARARRAAHEVSGELDLSDGKSYAQLVNTAATTVSGETRVVPNSPQSSFLIVKLVLLWQNGAPTTYGGPMPPDGKLSAEQLQAIQDWIADGAQNN